MNIRLVEPEQGKQKTRNFWDMIGRWVPIPLLAAILTIMYNQHSTIEDLKLKTVQVESGIKNDSIFIDKNYTSSDLTDERLRGILKLVEREKALINNLTDENLEEVYTKDAAYIKNIGGKLHKSTGYAEISRQYKNTDLRIEEVSKFNFRIYNTRLDNQQKPVEANLTYDLFIRYFYNNEERYELKTGKELMKLVYDPDKDRWLIKYFYIESA